MDALYLTPIFTSPSNHKYDASDFYHVDPAFGGDDALRALVAGLHARGMRLILDASFNHCHPGFFAFQDLIRNGPRSEFRDWFNIYDFPIRVTFRPHNAPVWAGNERRDEYMRWVRSLEEAGLPGNRAHGRRTDRRNQLRSLVRRGQYAEDQPEQPRNARLLPRCRALLAARVRH